MKSIANKNLHKSLPVIFAGVLLMLVAQGVLAGQTFTVTNTNDSGPGSLRQAIESANANPGLDVIAFNIPARGRHPGPGPRTIQPISALPEIEDPVIIDGYTQAGALAATVTEPADLKIVLDGSQAPNTVGLFIRGSAHDCIVRGLQIQGFRSAIGIAGNHNSIEGNHILDSAHDEVFITGAYNTVGGPTSAQRNVVAGNHEGIRTFPQSSHNNIQGNYIGTDPDGQSDSTDGWDGVTLGGSYNTVVDNLISGYHHQGILIMRWSTTSDPVPEYNVVEGNKIGTNADGTSAIPNGHGISINSARYNTVAGNLISGNSFHGILISNDVEALSTGNIVQGNYIGTDVTGTTPLGNGNHGVEIREGASDNTIGPGNVISGNGANGVFIKRNAGAENLILGNLIGTNAAGTASIGNNEAGIVLNSPENVVGGTTEADRNIISGSVLGVVIGGDRNQVLGNYIGTDVTGTAALGNSNHGIMVGEGTQNIIGPNNLISGNTLLGVLLIDNTTENKVIGNYIGTNASATSALPNPIGVHVLGAQNNVIGGTMPGEGNLISGNSNEGILIYSRYESGTDAPSTGNVIQGNYIGTDSTGTVPLSNKTNGIRFGPYASNNLIGGMEPGASNVISANRGNGIEINGAGVTGNQILGNFIGTDASGREALGNTSGGVRIISCSDNTLTDNTVSNNGYGIRLQSSSDNQIYNNNFIDNTIQAYATTGRGGNIFNLDKPIGGNYWSDWTSPDADGDGFVDYPYVFTDGGDYLPWVFQDGWLPTPPPPYTLSEALDTALSFTTGGSEDWFAQTKTSYYGGDAAQSGDISESEDSWMQTTVSGTGTVKFCWKVSSEGNFDFLEFYIDGSLEDQISGSVNWQQKTYTITTSGLHTLEWRYVKDDSEDSGSDCGWVDKLEWVPTPLPPPTLSEALDTALSFTTGGSEDWFGQTKTSYYGGDAARSGDISHSQDSWMQTMVSGPGALKFYWKVSSEENYDFLEFYIDGWLQDQISGSVNWQQKTYTITTSGSHMLEWRYVKEKGTDSGSDCGWVDKVEWVAN